MNYQHAKLVKQAAQQVYDTANELWQEVAKQLFEQQGLSMIAGGLTPDSVKFHPDYQAAAKKFQAAHERLREINSWFVKAYKKEYAAERAARYTSLPPA